MSNSEILAFIGTHLPYVLLASAALVLAFLALFMAFVYRGKALNAGVARADALENELVCTRERLEDAIAAMHTQAARAQELDTLRPAHEALRDDLSDMKSRAAAQQAAHVAREEALRGEIKTLTALKDELKVHFDTAANKALHSNRQAFMDLANETFAKHKRSADADMVARHKAIETMLSPVQVTLKRYEEGLSAVERARREAYGALSNELKSVATAQEQVRKEASKLSQAMRGSPKARGRWGEHQLQNIMELSGMAQYVDFTTQVSVENEGKRLMPDAVIRLPGDRRIVVDAKASMSAYLDAVDAQSDAQRQTHLQAHAKAVREHVKQLAAKRYWDALDEAPDFVVMFLPNDALYTAAVDMDPELLDFGLKNKVLITTPTTMMGFAKSVAYGWRQERMATNAKVIAALGQDLYKRLAALGDHLAATGKGLNGAVTSYNKMIGALERSVLPQARKFRDLEVEGTGEALPHLMQVEQDARMPVEGRDLAFSGDATVAIAGTTGQTQIVEAAFAGENTADTSQDNANATGAKQQRSLELMGQERAKPGLGAADVAALETSASTGVAQDVDVQAHHEAAR